MAKTIHSKNYEIAISLLKKERVEANISQVELAERMNTTQSYISKCERRERRMDLIESLQYCEGINLEFSAFAKKLENKIKKLKNNRYK